MIAAAVIVARGESGISPLTQLGGLSLLKRAVLAVQKVGVTTCYIVIDQDQEALQSELCADARVTARLIWVQAHRPPTVIEAGNEDTSCVAFATDTIFRHPLLSALAPRVVSGKRVVVADINRAPALVFFPVTQLSVVIANIVQQDPFQSLIVLPDERDREILTNPGYFFCRLKAESSLENVERALLHSLENPRDGLVDAHFNRKVSRPITRWLLRTSLSPNQVTLLSCVVGLLGAVCFVPGGYWGPLWGACLLQFSAVLDCCDGEIARVKFMESPFGDWLDIVCDTVVHLAIFLGMGVAVWRDGTSAHALTLAGMLVLGGFLAFPVITLAEKTEEMGERRRGWEDRWIKKLLATLTTRDFSVLIVASAIVGKLTWFLWGAAIGAHVFWIVFAFLLLRAGRFSWIRIAGERKEI